MARRNDELAVRTIVVTFLAALHTVRQIPVSGDIRASLAEGARDRALQLLSDLEQNLPYEAGSYLDRAIQEARQQIERAKLPHG